MNDDSSNSNGSGTATTTTTITTEATSMSAMTPIDFSHYPPNPIVWTYIAIDTVCDNTTPFVGCSNWRSWLPPSWTQTETSWFSETNKLQVSLVPNFPPMTPYTEYITQQQQSQLQPKPYSFQSIYNYAFHTPSTSLAVLTTNTSLLTLVLLVLVVRTVKAWCIPLFSAVGRTAGRHTHGRQWEQSNEVRITKFGEYVFRLFFHGSISLAGIWLFYREPWWAWLIAPPPSSSSADYSNGSMNSTTSSSSPIGTKSLFLDYPFQPVEPGMIWYYLIQAAYNIEAMLCLLELSFDVSVRPLLTDNKKKKNGTETTTKQQQQYHLQWPLTIHWSQSVRGDFREMFVHHIVTNMLVFGSSYFRITRVGSMVFLVHDISDVPVDLSKLANFLKWKFTTVSCFCTLVMVWLATRLLVFPFVIYRSVLFEAWLVCANGYIHPIYHVMYQPIFVVLIGLLIFLHFVWFTMFIRMGYVLIRKGEAHDFSEHKKGEQAGGSSTTTKTTTAITNGTKKGN
jgi:hypothetical protein